MVSVAPGIALCRHTTDEEVYDGRQYKVYYRPCYIRQWGRSF